MSTPRVYREYERNRKAKWRSANPERAKRNTGEPSRPMVGVDGEGYDDEQGRHRYNMLRAGGWLLSPNFEKGQTDLSTYDCLSFLTGLDPESIYVAYFFDYDVTMILRDIGWTKLTRLINRESRMRRDGKGYPFPVDVLKGEFQIDYMPRKFFKVRRRIGAAFDDEGNEKPTYSKWIVINDVGPFFQCRFVQALELWNVGTPEQRAQIADGKEQRNSHRQADYDRIKLYNAMECHLLAKLMEQFRDACKDVGYVPRQWQGPGQIAEAMLYQNGIPKSSEVPMLADPRNEGLLTFARNAFYGGRPEITVVGQIEYPVYQWDINSAYPYALMHVPCLMHGSFRHEQISKSKRASILTGEQPGLDIQPMGIYYGSFNWNRKGLAPNLYGLPIRREKGTISYPASGRGWYWGFEILASVHQNFHAIEGYVYVEDCRCVPFGWIQKVYAMRKTIGKDGRGIVLKLALNSLYGKMAQSVGKPKYANPIWASFITAFCRTQIQELLHSCHSLDKKCGRGVWMIATDAIFTSYDLPVKESESLGGYSKEFHPNGIFLVQPGLYFRSSLDGNGRRTKPKTRGVPLTLVVQHEQDFRDNFRRMLDTRYIGDGTTFLPVRTFVGIRQALHRHNLNILGQWISYGNEDRPGKAVSFDWTNKRMPGFAHTVIGNNHIKTIPQKGRMDLETIPYSKDIGRLLDQERIPFMDQPDWADQISSMEEA